MNIWLIIGLVLLGTAVGLYVYWHRQQAKLREEARREEARNAPEKEAGPVPSSKTGSASSWLHSLVKAEGDEKKIRRGF